MSKEIDLSQFESSFVEEALENISIVEGTLLELERTGGDTECLHRIFRAIHSVKGGAGMFGFADVGGFAHKMENLLDAMRTAELEVTPALTSLLIRATDTLKVMVEGIPLRSPIPAEAAALCRALAAALPVGNGSVAAPAEPRAGGAKGARTYDVRFEPNVQVFAQGMDPALLVRNLCALGDVVSAELDTSRVPHLASLNPEECHVGWSIRIATERPEAELRDVFSFVEDDSVVEIRAVEAVGPPPAVQAVAPQPVASGAKAGQPQSIAAAAKAGGAVGTMRVATDKVDRLIDLVGELVIQQAMISQALTDLDEEALARLREAAAGLERSTRELQESVLSVRMVPVGSIFNRFHRIVRDVGQATGKKVALTIDGEDTEMDKGLVEQLADPLTHLIRNAVDHGLETSAGRVAAGKPETGTIRLSASHEAGSVVIEVEDDGRGLDTARIREKGVALGLIRQSDDLSDEQVWQLIFAPGFSTAASVTDISGRGVGMDVVRRNIDALSGTLQLKTEPGKGTLFRIKLPLTLAIVDGLALRVGRQTFVLPLLTIVEALRPSPEQLRTAVGTAEMLVVRGQPVPLIRLYDVLGVKCDEPDPCKALVVIVEAASQQYGFVVDELLGQAQVVVKNLEVQRRKLDGILGATILGDGSVGLILEVEALARRAASGRRASPRMS